VWPYKSRELDSKALLLTSLFAAPPRSAAVPRPPPCPAVVVVSSGGDRIEQSFVTQCAVARVRCRVRRLRRVCGQELRLVQLCDDWDVVFITCHRREVDKNSLSASLPGVDRRVRGDVALVGGGGDAREVAQNAVKPGLKLIMQSMDVASQPACARRAMVAMVVEQVVAAAALHGTAFLRDVIRLPGGEAKGRRHQGAPAPLAALALVVEEVGVHSMRGVKYGGDEWTPKKNRNRPHHHDKHESIGLS